jgi:hypothetical protein
VFKPVTVKDSLTVYSLDDPAIDWEALTEADEQKRDRKTLHQELLKLALKQPSVLGKRLKFKAGETPMRVVVGVVPSDIFTRILEEHGGNVGTFWWCCFLYGVRNLDFPEKPETHLVENVEYVKPEWLKQRFVRNLRSVGTELGSYVLAFNKFEEDEARL